jgi:ribulose-5-phosphate 4-epimerase/fuculose-1-phosphate aldolase
MTHALNIASLRSQVSDAEWQARVNLAACYRLVALFGWDDLVYTHISLRVPGEPGHFLINPYGLFFDEITASSLIKVDHTCQPLHATDFPVNPAGFIIHSAVHEGRPDVACVLHTHTLHGVAVSAQKDGLLPLSQHSLFPLTQLRYHTYEGVAVKEGEKARLVADLGAGNFMILRNHGLLTCGRSVAEAFQNMYFLEAACRMQVLAQAGGAPLLQVPQAIQDEIPAMARTATRSQGADQLVWPGLLRRLDRRNPGYDQ